MRGPKELYDQFRFNLPKYPIGFRGQSNQFTTETLENGFDKPREYFVVNLDLDWKQMRGQIEHLKRNLQFSSHWGENLNFPDDDSTSVGDALAHYQESPEEYTSLILLRFPGIKGKIYTLRPNIGGWNKARIPNQFIAGVVTLKSEDFEKVRKRLERIPGNLVGTNFSDMHKQLGRMLIKRFVEGVIRLSQEEVKGL